MVNALNINLFPQELRGKYCAEDFGRVIRRTIDRVGGENAHCRFEHDGFILWGRVNNWVKKHIADIISEFKEIEKIDSKLPQYKRMLIGK